jgi:hypothetical protein
LLLAVRRGVVVDAGSTAMKQVRGHRGDVPLAVASAVAVVERARRRRLGEAAGVAVKGTVRSGTDGEVERSARTARRRGPKSRRRA